MPFEIPYICIYIKLYISSYTCDIHAWSQKPIIWKKFLLARICMYIGTFTRNFINVNQALIGTDIHRVAGIFLLIPSSDLHEQNLKQDPVNHRTHRLSIMKTAHTPLYWKTMEKTIALKQMKAILNTLANNVKGV